MLIGAEQAVGDESRRLFRGIEMVDDDISRFVDRRPGVDVLGGLAFIWKNIFPETT